MKQTYGYTPSSIPGQAYVPYIAASEDGDNVIITVREGGSTPATSMITLPALEAKALAHAILGTTP